MSSSSISSPAVEAKNTDTPKIIAALIAVYIIWGSTYLGMAIALESFPPFILSALRFWIAGTAMLILSFMRGERLPALRPSLNAVLIGCLTLAAGTGSVAMAEQWVSSGLAALAVASVPLWAAIFAVFMIKRPSNWEWIGLGIGFSGVILLNTEGSFRAEPWAAIALIIGPALWSFASILSKKINMPSGWMSLAIQMLGAAVLTTILAFATGEQFKEIKFEPVMAILYLATFGSMIGFSAYMYLLGKVRPALATSYAYVNPIVAVVLGIMFAGETISSIGIVAMGVILTGVVIVVMAKAKS
jgi:drug/metabolite transporter (DMT)-like permease